MCFIISRLEEVSVMPLYEFRCDDCGKLFEKLVSGADSPVACVNCKSSRVKKQFSVFATRGSEAMGEDAPSEACNSCSMPGQGMCGFNPH